MREYTYNSNLDVGLRESGASQSSDMYIQYTLLLLQLHYIINLYLMINLFIITLFKL